MTADSARTIDALGIEIRVGDTVTVISYGGRLRLSDTGRRAIVTGFTRAGNAQLDNLNQTDPIAGGAAVGGGFLAVARRDGSAGHEGNSGRLLVLDTGKATARERIEAAAAAHGWAVSPRSDVHEYRKGKRHVSVLYAPRGSVTYASSDRGRVLRNMATRVIDWLSA